MAQRLAQGQAAVACAALAVSGLCCVAWANGAEEAGEAFAGQTGGAGPLPVTTLLSWERAAPPSDPEPALAESAGWVGRRLERIDPQQLDMAYWVRGLNGVADASPYSGAVQGALNSTWLIPRSDLPHAYLIVRWTPETGLLELRGVRLRMRSDGMGVYLERGDEDRDAPSIGFDFRRAF